MLDAEQIENWTSVDTDGKTVWVNRGHTCVGRFSAKAFEIVFEEGGRATRIGPMTIKDWIFFKEGIRLVFNVEVSDLVMPAFLLEKETVNG